MNIEQAIVIKGKTKLEQLVTKFNTKAQARFYIEQNFVNFKKSKEAAKEAKFDEVEEENEVFHQSLSNVERELSKRMKIKVIDREFLSSFIFSEKNLIVVVGQDGLVANTAKYVNGLPIIAVNPDKSSYDGQLLPFDESDFLAAVENVLADRYRFKNVTMAEARMNDGQRLLAFNDLFIGVSSHVSARYRVNFNNKAEDHSSSGIIVSTGAGSTGWLSSVFNMANSVFANFGGLHQRLTSQLAWDDERLMFIVREPFMSKMSQANIVSGMISKGNSLTLESKIPANGVIFSDGIEKDFIQFNSGSIAVIGIAPEKAKLVVK